MAIFRVPSQYEGKTLAQIRDMGFAFRPDLIGNENQPLKAGQQFSYTGDSRNAELQFLQQNFTGEDQFQQDQLKTLQEAQRGREEDFLTRFRGGLTSAISGIEGELGLPGLRTGAQAAGQTARGVQDQFRAIPQTQQTVAKQVGISAPRLQQRISAKSAELQPTLETSGRQLEEAQRAQEFGENEFGRRIGQYLAPFETESKMLSESLAREFSGFTLQFQGELEERLARIRNEGLVDVANVERATELAKQEQDYLEQRELINLGNRQALINPQTGQEISSYNMGLAPQRLSTISGWEYV